MNVKNISGIWDNESVEPRGEITREAQYHIYMNQKSDPLTR